MSRGALRRLTQTEVCIGLDIAHFPSLMYDFLMQQHKTISVLVRAPCVGLEAMSMAHFTSGDIGQEHSWKFPRQCKKQAWAS